MHQRLVRSDHGRRPRPGTRRLFLRRRERLQQLSLLNQGITFAVYGDREGTERVFPFDFVPRIIPAEEWRQIESGLVQRVTALNLFLKDVYTERACLKEGILPWDLVLSRPEYKRELLGILPPRDVFTHIVGTDLIRDESGEESDHALSSK